MESNLHHQFLTVRRGGIVSYGGNQSWFDHGYMRKSGCGVICSMDLLLYLNMYKAKCSTEFFQELPLQSTVENHTSANTIPMGAIHNVVMEEDYSYLANQLHWKYFPVIPHLGMPGWSIVMGLNRYFRKYRIPLRASWGLQGRLLWKRMEEMLKKDIPVILAVGPNFPFTWTNHKLAFYMKKRDGGYERTCSVKAHFVTVTAMNDTWIRISSWGKEYYIKRKEYMSYVKKYSSFLVSNLIYIKEI